MHEFYRALLVLAVAELSTPAWVKPFSDYLPNEHCPPWQLFNNECKNFYYKVSCQCDAQCNNVSCANSPRYDDPDATNSNVSLVVTKDKEGNGIPSTNTICCRNPFKCTQECMAITLHLACPSAPDGWTLSKCPSGRIFSGCSDDSDCPKERFCCLNHNECAYGCQKKVQLVDPWY